MPYIRARAQDYYEELGGGVSPDIEDGMDARRLRALTDRVSEHFRRCLAYSIFLRASRAA